MSGNNWNSIVSSQISDDELRVIRGVFKELDPGGCGYLGPKELTNALDRVTLKFPGWHLGQFIEEFVGRERSHLNKLSIDEFERLCTNFKKQSAKSLKAKSISSAPKDNVKKLGTTSKVSSAAAKCKVQKLGTPSKASSEGSTSPHTFRTEQQLAFSHWVNKNLCHDPDLKHLLPTDAKGKNINETIKDGILLCKMINHSSPNTIDQRAINFKNLTKQRKLENLTLAVNSARAIGCTISDLDENGLMLGKPHLELGLLWQIIRTGLLNQVHSNVCPDLVVLLLNGERIKDLLSLPSETMLLRWVNYQLGQAGGSRVSINF